ncbi:MAG: FAD:protein FMN transferase [Acutalibacteraceae bacterium]
MAKIISKKKRILKIVLCTVAVILVVAGAVLYNVFKTDYDCSTKNAVAMGTLVTVKTYGKADGDYKGEGQTIVDIIQQLDDVISWRESGSAVSELNEKGTISQSSLSDVINTCNKISKDSGGAFDITIGPVSRLWGIGTEDERLPSDEEIKNALKKVDYKKLKVNGTQVSCGDGQFIDLGAVGKGYACDMIQYYLENSDVKGAVVSVGGSILAYGKRNKAGDKWRIAIRDPRNKESNIGAVKIKEGFVSTSGDYEKYFIENGKRYHHLLDARTGYPADNGLISVTIVSDNGLLSDALSTACFLLGKEEGSALCEKYGASGVFIDEDMNITTVGDVDFERFSQ